MNELVNVLGILEAAISFDAADLHKPVVGEVIDVKHIGNLDPAYLVTMELTDKPSKTPRGLSWFPLSKELGNK